MWTTLPLSGVQVFANDDVFLSSWFDTVNGTYALRSLINLKCLCQLHLRCFYAYTIEPKQKEKLRSISWRSAFLRFRTPYRAHQIGAQHTAHKRRCVRADSSGDCHRSRSESGRVRFGFGSVGSDAGGNSHHDHLKTQRASEVHEEEHLSPACNGRNGTDPVRLEVGISISFSMTAGMRWFWPVSSSFHR